MGVFLRWGVLGIVSIAALVYAYNSSKRMAEARAARSAPAVTVLPRVSRDVRGVQVAVRF